MQLKDLKHLTQEQILDLEFSREDISLLDLDENITLHKIDNAFMLKQRDLLFQVDNVRAFNGYNNLEHSLWLPLKIKKQQLLMGVIPCLPSDLAFDAISALIDETVIEQIAKKLKAKDLNIEIASNWLKDEFILYKNDIPHVLFATNNQNLTSSIHTIVGKRNLMQIEFTKDNKCWVKSIKTQSRNIKFNLTICKMEMSFVDHTAEAIITDPLMKAKLQELNRDNSTYINLWNEYNEKVKEKSIEQAKNTGFIRYVKFETTETVDGVQSHFYFQRKDLDKVQEFCEALKEQQNAMLEINQTLPPWLENNIGDISFEKNEKTPSINAKLTSANEQYVTLNLHSGGKIQKTGVIYLSIAGSIVQMQRREKARDAITQLTNPMKDLRFLIEDRDISITTHRRGRKPLEALTSVARKSFKGKPTDKQIEALDVALNTPDIALILGPPGTGKTQVISAIQNRLAEEHKSELTGQILLTSFQNDAVDNVIARSEAFGIPAIRADDRSRAPFLLEKWSEKQTAHLTQLINTLSETEGSYKIIKNIRKDIAVIFDSRVERKQKQARVASLIEDAEHLKLHHGIYIPQDPLNVLERHFITDAPSSKPDTNKSLIRRVRGLRTTSTSFSDDGFEQLFLCLQALKRAKIDNEDVDYLKLLSDEVTVETEQLKKLSEIKNRLLDILLPDYRPRSLQAQLSDIEIQSLNELYDFIQFANLNSPAGIPDVIAEYQETMKYQPEYLAMGIQQYTTSLGASCQRSVKDDVVRFKSDINLALQEVSGEHQFDTVIVDEAARANPLDLFIPMALASRRIVLVGDHFQLPQMLEPDVESEMLTDGTLDSETAKAIKMSLFERLYTQLKQREAKDGIQRTVMLDTQFRMHSKLGDFISDNAPGFKTTSDNEEKLRVGSVDAFQGKEFDVVILSTVRSNKYKCADELSFRKKYGFIRTPNRLNVAFSRAKSLIKVVGDKEMFIHQSARDAIPQVYNFYHTLCEAN